MPTAPLKFTSLLFTPGSRPERFEKALASGADGIIVDLEDAVPVMDKGRVRTEIVQYFKTNVRIGMKAKVTVALARELAGFVWALLTQVPIAKG